MNDKAALLTAVRNIQKQTAEHKLDLTPPEINADLCSTLYESVMDDARRKSFLRQKLDFLETIACGGETSSKVFTVAHPIEDVVIALSRDVGRDYEDRQLFEHVLQQETLSIALPNKVLTLASVVAAVKLLNVTSADVFFTSNFWADIIGDNEFTNAFDPISKYEMVMDGHLGMIMCDGIRVNVYTDAYKHPDCKMFSEPTVVVGPETKWGTGERSVKETVCAENALMVNSELSIKLDTKLVVMR